MPIQSWEYYDSEGNLLGNYYNYTEGLAKFELARWCKYYENGKFKREFFVNI